MASGGTAAFGEAPRAFLVLASVGGEEGDARKSVHSSDEREGVSAQGDVFLEVCRERVERHEASGAHCARHVVSVWIG